jgi:endosialidase-like protein/trimeric autotransporter adhesin
MTSNSITLRGVLVGLVAAAAAPVAAQTPKPEIEACYRARTSSSGGSGIVYRINVPGVPADCVHGEDVLFKWTNQHGALTGLGNDDHLQYLLVNGGRALTGNLSAGGFKITGLGAATAAGDAVPFEQAVKAGDAASGDLIGTYPNPGVGKLQGRPVSTTAPTAAGQVLSWDGLAWAPTTAAAATGTSTNTPNTLVQRDGRGGFAAGTVTLDGGFSVTSAGGATGAGTRLMWHPGKGAFRAGRALGTEWDEGNAGVNSTATGSGTTASGGVSTAMGTGTKATGLASTAMGVETTASGAFSTAMGAVTTASGPGSTAMGTGTTASVQSSTAMGDRTTASGQSSTAMGVTATASGFASLATGEGTLASGNHSTAMGLNTQASGVASLATGEGSQANNHGTAMGFFSAAAVGATAIGTRSVANGFRSTALGTLANAAGEGSFVYGDNSTTDFVITNVPNQFVVRASGGFRFRTSPNTSAGAGTGCDLPAGTGAFMCTSDRNRKENFRDEDGEGVLQKIARMPIRTWNWKDGDPGIRHLGPTAQDFYAAFGLGEGETTISMVDTDGVNLLAVQALERRTAELREKSARIEALEAQLVELERRLAALEGALTR